MPRSSAVCRKCWSTSSSVCSNRRTIIRYVSSLSCLRDERSRCCMSERDLVFEVGIEIGTGQDRALVMQAK